MKTVIGIDLGGTNVRVAKITEQGEVLQEIKSPSYGMEGPEKVTSNIINLVKQIEGYKECAGIGIGVPGPVDTINRVMKLSSNLKGFVDYPLAAKLEEATGLPTFMDNDANVAGLAEARVGAGKGVPIVYYVTISTGIGGALCVDGKVVSGRNGYAGEIGNIIIDRNRKKYNHLNPGAVENEASGTAIGRIGSEEIGEHVTSAREVFGLAGQNDPKALEIIDRISYDFAQMMSVIAHVCDPHVFVIGGGCSMASDLYFDKLEKYYNSMVHTGMRGVAIRKAVLKEPGVIGAAMLVKSRGL